jgi:hypothetical protein
MNSTQDSLQYAQKLIGDLFHTDDHHGAEHHDHGHGDHHSYKLAPQFEFAVECINSFAGIVVFFAVFLTVLNLFVVSLNSMLGKQANKSFCF